MILASSFTFSSLVSSTWQNQQRTGCSNLVYWLPSNSKKLPEARSWKDTAHNIESCCYFWRMPECVHFSLCQCIYSVEELFIAHKSFVPCWACTRACGVRENIEHAFLWLLKLTAAIAGVTAYIWYKLCALRFKEWCDLTASQESNVKSRASWAFVAFVFPTRMRNKLVLHIMSKKTSLCELKNELL